jgi:hypothetical protein
MGCRAWSRRDVLMVERGLGRREGRTLVCGCCSAAPGARAPPAQQPASSRQEPANQRHPNLSSGCYTTHVLAPTSPAVLRPRAFAISRSALVVCILPTCLTERCPGQLASHSTQLAHRPLSVPSAPSWTRPSTPVLNVLPHQRGEHPSLRMPFTQSPPGQTGQRKRLHRFTTHL